VQELLKKLTPRHLPNSGLDLNVHYSVTATSFFWFAAVAGVSFFWQVQASVRQMHVTTILDKFP